MKVKNISSRLHHVGADAIAPGATVEIADSWLAAINPAELVVVEGPKPAKSKAAPAPAPVE